MVAAFKPDLHTELQERLRFETLIADLSLRFVNVPADRVDRENPRCTARDLRVFGTGTLLALADLYTKSRRGRVSGAPSHGQFA